MEGMHPEELYMVRNGYGLGDQQQQWWRTFERFMVNELGFEQHSMDPCVFIFREPVPASQEEWISDDHIAIIGCAPEATARSVRGRPGELCGILGVHVDDQINGGRGLRWTQAMEKLQTRSPFRKWVTGSGECHKVHPDTTCRFLECAVPQVICPRDPAGQCPCP